MFKSDDIVALDTDRLRLWQWREDDYSMFAAMNADPDVMAYYPAVLTRAESGVMADKLRNLIATRGWGFWAVEEKQSGQFIDMP